MPRLITSTPAARLAAILRSSSANAYGGMRSRRLLGLMQLLHEVVTQAAVKYGSRPACQIHTQILPHLDLQLAAIEHDRDGSAPLSSPSPAEHVCDRGARGAGARGQRLPH